MNRIGKGMRNMVALCLATLVLAACVSGKAPTTTYTDRAGKVTTIESDRESCVHSCNADYERCMDRGSYQGAGPGSDATSVYGVSATCHDDLKACLPRCKGR